MTEQKPDDELEVLMPDRDITINGEIITVHEFNFIKGLEAEAIAAPIISELKKLFENKDGFHLSDLSIVFAVNIQPFLQLLSMSTGKETEWLEKLGDTEGQSLMMLFWAVNAGFFTRRLVMQAIASQAVTVQAQPDGDASSPD